MCRTVVQSVIVMCALALLGAGTAVGEGLPDPMDTSLAPSERLAALLDRMRDRHERLETMEAEFKQLKESALFVEADRSRGVFSYGAPDRIRWEYTDPNPMSLLIADERMTIWYRDLDRAETAGVGKQSQRILEYMGASASMDKLVQYFSVSLTMPGSESEPFILRLKPRYERIAKRIRELETWIDANLYLPVRLRYVEGDGDVTEYEFTNFRINEGLPDGRFDLEIPETVEIRAGSFDSQS